jgi:hypothetical protein
MRSLDRRGILVLLLLLPAGLPDPAHPQCTAALTRAEMARFLATARIVSDRPIPVGVTHPLRVTLDDGRMRHDAAFSSVELRQNAMRFENQRTEIGFVDSYRYTLAAYEIAGLVGLQEMMPVMVERSYQNRKGALAWWLDVQMDEVERQRRQVAPPDVEAWRRQMARMKVFAELVGDTDRNAGNVLIDHEWKVWMIDFTRAFRRARQLRKPETIERCDRGLLQALRVLTRAEILGRARRYIGAAEADALLARRDLIVAHFERLAAVKGAAKVYFPGESP